MKRYLISGILILLACIGGICLPGWILEWQDRSRMETIEAEATEEVLLTAQTDLTLTEKINLLQKDDLNDMVLSNGKNYKYDTIEEKMREEVQKLEELEILNLNGQELNYSSAEVHFFIETDVEAEVRTLMLWIIEAATKEYNLGILLDDETGKILAVSQEVWNSMEVYSGKNFVDKGYGEAAEEGASEDSGTESVSDAAVKEEEEGGEPETSEMEVLAEKWGTYLGCTMTRTYRFPESYPQEELAKELKALIEEKGLSEKEAYDMIYEAWGIPREKLDNRIYAVYQDEGEIAAYEIISGDSFFSISVISAA